MREAFTLAEILVVIAIVVIIGSIGLANYKVREKDILNWEAEKVANLLKQAQVYALQARMRELEYETFRPYGYGVFFQSPSLYTFYSDQNEDFRYDEREKIIKYSLSQNIIFGFEPVEENLDILFTLPGARVYLNGRPVEYSIIITLKETTTQREKGVIINPISQGIDIQ